MNLHPIRPRRLPFFVRSALVFALGSTASAMALQGCATGNENNVTGSGGAMSESSSSSTGGTGQTGGTGGETAANSSSSAGGAGGTGGGTGGSFMPPMGTADYPSESESNDNATNANVFDSSTKGFTGSVHPIGDIDVYEVMVPTLGSDMTVRISDGMGGCPSGLSTAVRVNGSNGLLGAANGACPLIDPMSVPKMTNLPIGKTYVHVESASFEVEPFYVVEISLKTPVCGDGALRGTEQCDDGNKVSGDGCSATCMSEAPWEAEVNNTSDKATPLWPGTTLFKAAIKPVGDVDYFSFTLAAGQSPVLMTHDIDNPAACNGDTELTLFDSNGLEVISDSDSGPGACSSINSTLYPAVGMLSAGTYYVRVHDNMNDSVIAGYQLDVTVQ